MDNFFSLTPEVILNSTENALGSKATGIRATGYILPLNSVENRVIEIGLEDESFVVAKFYRPGRWTKEQILEEHQFLLKLSAAEIPVICPLTLSNSLSPTLGQTPNGIYFTLFPKVKGRLLDELDDSQIRQVGRYLARIHMIGETQLNSKRKKIDIENYLNIPLKQIKESKFIDPHSFQYFENICLKIKKLIEPKMLSVKNQIVHGDCHSGNILWRVDGQCFFLDFDDMVIAPPMQDIWMIIRGRDEKDQKSTRELISAYEIFKEFSLNNLSLKEPLRALRQIHYSAWILNHFEDPSFPKMFPDFGSKNYWQGEVESLSETLQIIEQSFNFSNHLS